VRSVCVCCSIGPAPLTAGVRPLSMRLWIKRTVALALGLATWYCCFHVASRAFVQTGPIVPWDVQVYRDVFRVLWFPLSWLPYPHFIGTWEVVVMQLVGVPYGVVVGLGVSWLLRVRQPKKI
jgi:hypothetical protein